MANDQPDCHYVCKMSYRNIFRVFTQPSQLLQIYLQITKWYVWIWWSMISMMFIEWPTHYALDPVDSPSFRDFQISERMRLFLSWIFFFEHLLCVITKCWSLLGVRYKAGPVFFRLLGIIKCNTPPSFYSARGFVRSKKRLLFSFSPISKIS